jgi:hypothetical protein
VIDQQYRWVFSSQAIDRLSGYAKTDRPAEKFEVRDHLLLHRNHRLGFSIGQHWQQCFHWCFVEHEDADSLFTGHSPRDMKRFSRKSSNHQRYNQQRGIIMANMEELRRSYILLDEGL